MSSKPPENRRNDPFRREPPVIDLKAKEVPPKASGAGPQRSSAAASSASSAASAGGGAKPAASASSAAAIPGVYSTGARASAPAGKPAPAATAAAAANTAAAAPKAGGADPIPSRRQPSLGFDAAPSAATAGAKPVEAKAAPGPSATAKPADAKPTAPSAPPRPVAASVPPSTNPKPASPAQGADKTIAGAAAASAHVEPARVEPARARSGAGTGALLTTGLLGGLICAGLIFGVDRFLDARDGGDEARLSAIEQRMASAPATPAGMAALERRLASLETANRGLSERIARPASAAPAVSGAAQPDSGMTTRLSSLEEASNKGLGDLRTQIAALRTSLDDQIKQSGAAAAINAAALAGVTQRLASLQSQSAGQAEAANAAVQAMQARLGEGEKRLDALTAELSKFGPSAAQAGLRVILAGQLGDALRDAQPLGGLVATAQKIGTPPDVIAPLQPYVDAAPPSAATLSREFEPLGRRMIEAARGPATSITDRLKRMADRIVTVRAVGEGGGSDIDAQVARIDAALARGAFTEAAAAWDALPDAARGTSPAFATRLKQRAAAGDAARRLSSDALAAIDASLR